MSLLTKVGGSVSFVSRVSLLVSLAVCTGFSQNGLVAVDSLNQRHGGPGPNFGFYYAACWGYVAPDGHEYAIIGTYSGMSIIDLDATPIREVAFISGANSEWKEMKTWGQYLYAVSEGNQGVQIIDLRQLPDTARLVRSVTSVGGKNVSRNHSITVSDGYLFLNGSTSGGQTGGAIILSLADPENPTFVGEYQPAYLHDVFVRRDTLYGAALGSGVYIASIANKSAPVQIGRITYTGSGTHNTWASTNGRFLFTSDEVGTTAKNMKVYDISNLPTVTPMTPFTPSPTTTIHNVHGRGNYVYISHYKAGVFIADVTNPAAIVNSGSFNTYRGGGTHSIYAGCWDVYPYFPSGRIIASDTQTGLYLFTFAGLTPRTRSPLLEPANGDSIIFNATRTFRWGAAASQMDDPHTYRLRIWGNGIDTSFNTTDTTFQVPAIFDQHVGQTFRWNVWIKDEYTSVSSRDTFQFVYGGSVVTVDEEDVVPGVFSLAQNYPNPFNPVTTITYHLPVEERVRLTVVDLLGREVATLVEGRQRSGTHRVEFAGGGLASGIYLYRLEAGSFIQQKKMVLVK